MGILLGLLSSLSFGTGDFIGGMLSRRGSALSVVLLSQAVGAALLVPVAMVVGSDRVGAGMAWGALAGVGVGTGVLSLYRGLARGRMGVVATVSAVVVAVIPVVAGFAFGEQPTVADTVGIVVAVAAVALIAGSGRAGHPAPGPAAAVETPGMAVEGSDRPAGRWAGLPEALAAGALLGLARIALERAPDVAGLWPVGAARVSGVVVLGLVALATRARIGLPSPRPWLVLVVGALEATASSLFLIGTTRGLLAVVSVVASLGPAVTVLLARVVVHERLSRLQVAGVALALVGVFVIALP